MKKLVSLCLVCMLSVSVFAGCGDGSKEVLETPTQGVTETSKPSEFEKALEAFISENDFGKADIEAVKVSYESSYALLTPASYSEDLSSVVPKERMPLPDGEDVSEYTKTDPGINGVKERILYKRIVKDEIANLNLFLWTFFADFSSVDGTLKWLEVDPMTGYGSVKSDAISINGICLLTPLAELLNAWGAPDNLSVGVKYGKDVVTLSWNYTLDKENVCVYATIAGFKGTDFSTAFVHDMYVDMKVGS